MWSATGGYNGWSMKTRLGIDVGTSSIGWCLVEMDEAARRGRIIDLGSRIFSDGREPKSGESLAVARRDARAMRRRRDRYLRRRSVFLEELVRFGLMPADADEARLEAAKDPYVLRLRALDEALTPYEVGRALFHLNQRRGFKSNRKAERKTKEPKDGKIESGAKDLDAAMQANGARTLGEFLAGRGTRRVRMGGENQTYDFYPQRRHVQAEFEAIWSAQARHHPGVMTDEARDRLAQVLFFQRDLKDQVIGKCTFAGWNGVPEDERRLAKAHPLFQERRLYEEVNNLKIVSPGEADRDLTRDQRDALILKLRKTRKAGFPALGKIIKLGDGERFNKHTDTRKDLLGDEVFAEMSDNKRFGDKWGFFDLATQLKIIDRVQNEEDPETLFDWLKTEYGLDDDAAIAVGKAHLPEGYGRFGETATRRLIEALKAEVVTYDKAAAAAGFHHSDRRTGEVWDELPYYGQILPNEIAPGKAEYGDPDERRFGKITNPTVHIGLRQLQKLINAVIKVHGRPDEIVVELARELKLNEAQKDDHNRRIKKDTDAAERRSVKLRELERDDNGSNRLRLRLWEELATDDFLNKCCPYCGRAIGIESLFSDAVDVDHIIPYSKSLDDSIGNKVVAHRSCNREKGNDTPYQAWATRNPERWETISQQVARMDKRKQWRFGPEAMERIAREGGFEARQLTDTQYLARATHKYVSSLYTPDEGRRVYVTPGRMTAMLRRLWGLNGLLPDHNFVENAHSNAPKNRLDHRHHTIDGAVTAVTGPGLIKDIATAAGRAEDKNLDRLFEDLKQPWDGFHEELKERVLAITVSHKPDHGRKGKPSRHKDVTAGRLHNDTAYGFTGDYAADGKTPIVVHRVPFMSLKPADIADSSRIPDEALRDALWEATRDLTGKAYEQALADIFRNGIGKRDKNGNRLFKGIRRVRVREPLNVIAIRDRHGRAYKAYKGDSNARYDVWRLPNGKWMADVVSMFDAHRPDAGDRRPHPAAKKVLSLRQNDLLAIERDGGAPEIVRVVKFSTNLTIQFAPDNEAGPLKARDATPVEMDPFKYINGSASGLKKLKARQVRIDPLGRVFDPGPRE